MTGIRARMRAAAAATPASDTTPLHPEIAAKIQKLRNEKAALTQQLRDTARERDQLKDQVAAGRLMLAAARRQCEAGCEHAQLAARRLTQLVEMQKLVDELQAVNEGYESRRWQPRDVPVAVPQQRNRRRG